MSEKPDVLIIGELAPRVMNALESAYSTHRYWEATDKSSYLSALSGKITAIATTGHYGASAEMIAALPNLKIISCYGVGVDAIDLDAAKAHGVTVTNTPDVLTDDVSNLAVTLLLTISRDIVAGDAWARSGDWETKGGFPLARSVRGRKAGIIGLGRIGLDIARKLEVFGLELAWHGPRDKPDAPYPYYSDPVALADWADYIILACPGGPSTFQIVNEPVMRALGPEGTLVNISRGSCVDEAALVRVMEEGALGWAALDVFENEPVIPEPLKASDRTVLQPHAGSGTVDTRNAMGDLVVENLALYYAGEPVKTPV